MPDTNTNDIDALLRMLEVGGWVPPNWSHAALTALVAERNALKQRVAELEDHPPADRDRELRERLVCAALTGLLSNTNYDRDTDTPSSSAAWSVAYADAALAAMRKGEA